MTYELIILFVGIALVWIVVTLMIVLGFNMIYGDDTEDKGKSTWIDTMLKRVQEWNRQKAINDSERFEK